MRLLPRRVTVSATVGAARNPEHQKAPGSSATRGFLDGDDGDDGVPRPRARALAARMAGAEIRSTRNTVRTLRRGSCWQTRSAAGAVKLSCTPISTQLHHGPDSGESARNQAERPFARWRSGRGRRFPRRDSPRHLLPARQTPATSQVPNVAHAEPSQDARTR